jgi:uncharacterized protein (DUF58 family)
VRNGVFPTPRALIAFAPSLALIVLAFFWPPLLYAGLAVDGLVVLLLLADFLLSPSYRKKLVLDLRFPAVGQLNRANEFVVAVTNRDRSTVRFRLLLGFDEACDREYGKTLLSAAPGETREHRLSVFIRRRGTHQAEFVFIKGRSTLGLLSFFRRRPLAVEVSVPPFIHPVNQIFKMTQKKLLKTEGAQKSAFLGEGRDFEMLRKYSKGDDFNKIDWKATARLGEPVTRVYRLENSLEVALLVDCGRIMATEVAGLSLLDYAADAALILAWSAVKNYDSVSLLCFDAAVRRFVPPIKTKKDIGRLSLALSQIEFEHVEPDYGEALRFTAQKLTKRSLVLLLTDLIDDSNLLILSRSLAVLRRSHLVMLALIRDQNLFRAAESPAAASGSLYTKAAAADLILRRAKTIAALRRLGVDILDVYPEEISASLINRYLDLKSRN